MSFNLCKTVQNVGQVGALSVSAVTDIPRWVECED